MTIEALLREHLLYGETGVLVGERVFAGRKPEKKPMPLVAYRRVTTLGISSHDGRTFWGPRFEISCWGANDTEARELRRAVVRDLDFARTAEFRSFIENDLEIDFPDAAIPRAIVDVRVWYDPALEDAS